MVRIHKLKRIRAVPTRSFSDTSQLENKFYLRTFHEGSGRSSGTLSKYIQLLSSNIESKAHAKVKE